jgi:hypothetical protein
LQLDSDNLFHAVIPEIGVLGRERRLGINAGHVRVDRLIGIGIQIDARGLPYLDLPDLSFWHKTPQIYLAQIQQGDDGSARRHHFPRFGGTRRHRTAERSCDDEILAVRLSLTKLRPGLFNVGGGAGDFCLLLPDLVSNRCGLSGANVGICQVRFG